MTPAPQPLIISVSHTLGKEEALRRLKTGLGRGLAGLPFLTVDEETWSGDSLAFRVHALGQSAAGTIDVAEDYVRLTVVLPWLLQKFAKAIQAAVKARSQVLLEKPKK